MKAADDHVAARVEGWNDALEAVAVRLENHAYALMSSRRGLKERILLPSVAEVFRAAAADARDLKMNDASH